MAKLVSYTTLPLDFGIQADLHVDQSYLQVNFFLQNQNADLQFADSPFQLSGEQMQRKDELWKGTCFEFFLQPVSENQYYEFNFDLKGDWNCYHFHEYRKPQPPKTCFDFEVVRASWNGTKLQIDLKNKTDFKKFNVGITAIIKDKNNQTFYFALKHAGEKPDFHLQNSFILQRGS